MRLADGLRQYPLGELEQAWGEGQEGKRLKGEGRKGRKEKRARWMSHLMSKADRRTGWYCEAKKAASVVTVWGSLCDK